MADIENIESRLTVAESRLDSHEQRLSKHGEEIDGLRINEASITATLGRIDSTVSKIDGKLDAVHDKPAQRWEDLMKQVIALLVTAVLAAALAQAGISLH